MLRIDHSSAAAALPTPAAAGTEGYFTAGDPVNSIAATVVTADFLNMVQEELLAIVDLAGLTHSKTNRWQVRDAIGMLVQQFSYVATTGANLLMVGTVPGNPVVANGFWLIARFPTVNTVDGPKMNINGLGAKIIYTKDFTTPLPAGQLPIEGLLAYHTILDGWVLLTEPAAGGYALDTNVSANACTVQIPGIRAYFDGLHIDFKCKTTNTGATTINITALGVKNIKYQGNALTAGQLVAGRIYRVAYNSVTGEFQLISPPG